MPTGQVKQWDEEQGYGFLTIDGTDVFVHRSHVHTGDVPLLHQGQAVDCDVVPGAPWPTAERVRKAGTPAPPLGSIVVAPPPASTDGVPASGGHFGTVDLSQLEECIGCEIVGVETVDKIMDELIRMESGDRYRAIDGTTPLVDEFDSVLILRDRAAGVYKLVTPYEVLDVRRLRPKF